ncbi:MAG: NapC/NirT family cytochrome c [Betaproteobacteria bacterium]|nr:NapC/NirT family cytochrome c [Betaproteobacteria bacterium]MDH5220693.1 NapC/NirT family cytochrome c [Betaproteobacteria bacterium]MDH5349707.1 NapC/NirT family cytochrome c [Betaproteobacteria bacterium]
MLGRFWGYLTTKCQTCSRIRLGIGVAVVAVLVAGVLMAAGAAGLAWTNTEGFCIGCHEMRDNVYAEFKDTIHDKNRSGVRAVCSDCHVPREPVAMLKRKMAATFEIWGKITGVIDTKEKFEKMRHTMAVREWTRMKKNNSQECRNCHHFEAMDPDKQTEKAKARHEKARAEGVTCIDCHFGIAHNEPDGPGPQELKLAK